MRTCYKHEARRVKTRFAYRSLPYGVGFVGDTLILFSRKYEPIARLAGRGPVVHAMHGHDQARRPCIVALPLGEVTPCDPSECIVFAAPVFFYSDGNSPRHNSATRAKLLRLVAVIAEANDE